MKTAIIYKTKTGSTKKYADWLAAAIDAKVMPFDQAAEADLSSFERLIVSSGTYAGRMPLTKFLKENWEKLEDKKIVILAVGAAPEDNWWSHISYRLIPAKIRKSSTYRKLPGDIGKSIKEEAAKKYLERVVRDLGIS